MIQSKGNIWPIQADTTGRDDFDFFITANGKYGIYYSDIDEYGMMKFVSPVLIWTDKENPRLLFQSKELQFEYQHGSSCYWLDKSDILVLLAPCPHQTHSDLLYILVDFNRKVFSTINAPNFRLTEIDKNLVRLDLDFRYSVLGEELHYSPYVQYGKGVDRKSLTDGIIVILSGLPLVFAYKKRLLSITA